MECPFQGGTERLDTQEPDPLLGVARSPVVYGDVRDRAGMV